MFPLLLTCVSRTLSVSFSDSFSSFRQAEEKKDTQQSSVGLRAKNNQDKKELTAENGEADEDDDDGDEDMSERVRLFLSLLHL
jgi:hypothetical protein